MKEVACTSDLDASADDREGAQLCSDCGRHDFLTVEMSVSGRVSRRERERIREPVVHCEHPAGRH
jgi:hypothetical protein